ncbi:MAG: rod shape-determining protein MreC [Nitriliruptoraceae bacterium]
MFQRRRARLLLALLIATAVALVTIDFRSGEDGGLDRLRATTTAVLRPIQDGVGVLVRPFSEGAAAVGDLFAIRSDNRELRARVATLEERRRVFDDLERENAELRALLAIADRTELDTVAARVVALAPSNFEWTITIDVGSDDGVERGMPVIDGDGLVGRVIQVTGEASRVLLAIDPSFSAAARSARNGEVGVLDGRGGDPMDLRLLDPAAVVEVGDAVTTSSYQGGVFPAGIPIGTVSQVGEDGSSLFREVQVNPYVDFTRLQHVLIVFSTGIDDIPAFEGSEGLQFRRPPVPSLLEPEAPAPEGTDGDGDGASDDDADGDGAVGDGPQPQALAPQALGSAGRRVLPAP